MTIVPPIANTYDGQQWVKAEEYMTLLREYHRLRLTDEERALLQSICDAEPTLPSVRSTLRSLLERTT